MRKFTCKPVLAADEKEDTRVADFIDVLKDDFNYALDSFDKLSRDGKVSEALEIMSQLNTAVQNAIEASANAIGE